MQFSSECMAPPLVAGKTRDKPPAHALFRRQGYLIFRFMAGGRYSGASRS
jgi:hypothetical protein